MTEEELKEQLEALEKSHLLAKMVLMREYCNENNPYKIGDTFTDHIGTVLIEKIMYSYGINTSCVYLGLELKKDGTPRKDGSKRNAYQCNEVKIKL